MECYRRIPLQSPLKLESLEVSCFEEVSLQRLTPKSLQRDIIGLYWGYIGVILGLYGENGKENGIYYLEFRVLGL